MKSLFLLLALSLPVAACAGNQADVSPSIKAAISQALKGVPIVGIHTTPIAGLYEVQSGDKIYYTDKTGKYLVTGHMFDTANKKDLTAARLAEINRINWSDLPLEDAIVSGPEDGLKMAVFTDPECPYCKRLEKQLQNETGIRVYTFLFPLTQLHPKAYEKAKSIWCAKDQHQAMIDVMLNGKTLPKGTCKTPVDRNIKLAEKLHVMGTPTMFAADGRKYAGGDLKAWLQQAGK
jgi:thiol:disulfide interchange protein DsbC